MKLTSYLKDKLSFIFLIFFSFLIILLLLLAFKAPKSLIIAITIILIITVFLVFLIDYYRKKSFYQTLFQNISSLDKSYLVLETIPDPTFYEGKLFEQALYNINKSMNENVKQYELQMTDFKEYIEMWIHEVKIPLSSLILMAHNHPDKFDHKGVEQIKHLENYVEQVLYYVRQDFAEKDYLINKINIKKVISNLALKNKDAILENNIELIVGDVNKFIYTDSKWLEFILNQIINNSIKYHRNIKNSYIKISTKEENEKIILEIEDNGIGIPASDIPKVFDKTYTGTNGRLGASSTGMGLFIAKNLCLKLGHKIEIESVLSKYTKVRIIFSKNKYYEVIK